MRQYQLQHLNKKPVLSNFAEWTIVELMHEPEDVGRNYLQNTRRRDMEDKFRKFSVYLTADKEEEKLRNYKTPKDK